jgi:hypothetical protein
MQLAQSGSAIPCIREAIHLWNSDIRAFVGKDTTALTEIIITQKRLERVNQEERKVLID